MNIVFVVVSGETFDDHRLAELPLGPAYIASYVKKHISNCNFSTYVGLPQVEKILERKPDLVGISSVSDNYNHAIELTTAIRQASSIPIVIGGHHISYLPQLLPREADAGVLFEGEDTFLELIRILEKQGSLPEDQLSNVDGIVFWDEDDLVQTRRRELIGDLDTIPFPDRDSIEYMQNVKFAHHIMTSRGCPHRCRFCSSHPFWRRCRYFSARYVVSEIEYLKEKYDVEHLHIYDDLWIANKKRLFEISDLIRKRGLHKKLAFNSWVTAKIFTQEVAETLADLNFKTVSIGFETGSDRILQYLKAGSASIDENRRAIKTAKKCGLKVGGSFMIGMPGETRDDIYETKRFITDNGLDHASIYLLKPLPGTEVWDYAIKEGLVSNDMTDWGILSNDDILAPNAILLNREVQPEVLNQMRVEIQDEIFKKHVKSALRQLFSGELSPRLLVHYIRRIGQKPYFVWSRFKGILVGEYRRWRRWQMEMMANGDDGKWRS